MSREQLLHGGVRVTVTKGNRSGGPDRLAGPDTSRLTITFGNRPGAQQNS
ncbi:hypothetical protein [Streptomyces sp. NBC_00878]|nr:hypothetical protein [Streptomyces sp. NBC_00878]MCX4906242.1 hypothetical protein [Streptomyces sp. NBC_00878]